MKEPDAEAVGDQQGQSHLPSTCKSRFGYAYTVLSYLEPSFRDYYVYHWGHSIIWVSSICVGKQEIDLTLLSENVKV